MTRVAVRTFEGAGLRARRVDGNGTAILNAWSGGELITHTFRFEPLLNGLIRVENRTAKAVIGTWNPDGTVASGAGGIFADQLAFVVRLLYGS